MGLLSIMPLSFVCALVLGTLVSCGAVETRFKTAALHQGTNVQGYIRALPYGSSPSLGAKEPPNVMLNDKKKSLSDNEVLDVSTKSQLELLLSELRQVRTEIREARQEHGRLASGVAEISGQVRVISDRKDQIKKKIRKLTKTLTKKDHHRKVKSGLRSLQQDHERIFQAMTKAKLLSRANNRRNNKTNHHNHNSTHPGNNRNKNKKSDTADVSDGSDNSSTSVEATANDKQEVNGKRKRNKNRMNKNKNGTNEEEEIASDNDAPVVLPIELEKKSENRSAATTLSSSTTTTSTTTTTSPTTPSTTTTTTTTSTTTTTPEPTSAPLPVNCYEVLQYGNWTSGVYTVQPGDLPAPHKVWCDQRTDGGGWTILVARKPQDDQEDFTRPWQDYKDGFGDPGHEHWLGLETLHQMTKNQRHELRVNITDWSNKSYHAVWKEFSVASEDKMYTLNVGRYSSMSTAGDALKWHGSMKFSTIDMDNDALMGGHCARLNKGGWWYRGYRGCYQAHPTGIYQTFSDLDITSTPATGEEAAEVPEDVAKMRYTDHGPYIFWGDWRNGDLYPKTMFLMIRPSLN